MGRLESGATNAAGYMYIYNYIHRVHLLIDAGLLKPNQTLLR